jgi:hypothetical protein
MPAPITTPMGPPINPIAAPVAAPPAVPPESRPGWLLPQPARTKGKASTPTSPIDRNRRSATRIEYSSDAM